MISPSSELEVSLVKTIINSLIKMKFTDGCSMFQVDGQGEMIRATRLPENFSVQNSTVTAARFVGILILLSRHAAHTLCVLRAPTVQPWNDNNSL